MKTLVLILAAMLSGSVNPFIGTDGHGHTFPGAAYPFGMVQLSPDTRPLPGDWDGCSGYHWSDNVIYGFSHTHLCGTGCDDLCDLLIMPSTAKFTPGLMPRREEYASGFSHGREKASPGYYEVWLERPQVMAKMTVGRRSGMHEYEFPKGESPVIVIDLTHRDHLIEDSVDVSDPARRVIRGRRRSSSWAKDQDLYFHIEFSRPYEVVTASGKGAVLSFKPSLRNVLTLRVGISSVSEANAAANLASEGRKSFNSLRKAAESAWEAYLSKLECPSDGSVDRTAFYTALYHTAIHPSLYSDVNGEYRGMDHKVHKAEGWERYHIFSLWDTFRGLHPLLSRIEPERTVDFLRTFISIYEEGGKLPVWELCGNETDCMIGYNSAPVIADAIAAGPGLELSRDELARLTEALIVSSRRTDHGLGSFRTNGAVLADDDSESVSKTLEYAYDDWCVAQVVKKVQSLGIDVPGYDLDALYSQYMVSAQYWRNVFDPETGFARARINGRWCTPFNPREVNNHYTEANSWQYSFFVPHDIGGLMEAMGGKSAFGERLDALFTAPEQTTGRTQADITGLVGQYAHGNEPSHHIAYLYRAAGHPEKTGAMVSRVMKGLYGSGPDGLCGNEDCGQMSAWYVLSALDLYPVCPGIIDPDSAAVPYTIVENPVFEMDNDVVQDSMEVSIVNIHPGAQLYWRRAGGSFEPYAGPFTVADACTLEAYAECGGVRSALTRTSLRKVRDDMDIRIMSRYNPQYTAGGEKGLIDGYRAPINWKAGGWQGYQAQDFEAVVDLRTARDISVLGAGFCQDARSWIWMPRHVEFSVSSDGIGWTPAARVLNDVAAEDMTVQVKDFSASVDLSGVRYVKVFARYPGTIPDWHPGAGYESFIFIDEIWVE